jgi:hypothetical protein
MAASSHMRRAAHLTEMFAMASASTNAFAIGATVLSGLLAGPAVNRVLVELPAWALDGNATFWKHAMAMALDPMKSEAAGWFAGELQPPT